MGRQFEKVVANLRKGLVADSHAGVVASIRTSAGTDAVPVHPNRSMAKIVKRVLFKNDVFTLRGKQDKVSSVSHVGDIRQAIALATRPRELVQISAISVDKLNVDSAWFFVQWNAAGEVKVVPMADQICRQVLHHRFHTCGLAR